MARPISNVKFDPDRVRFVVQEIAHTTLADVAKQIVPGTKDENKIRRFRGYMKAGTMPPMILRDLARLCHCSYGYLAGAESKSPQDALTELAEKSLNAKAEDRQASTDLDFYFKNMSQKIDFHGVFVGFPDLDNGKDTLRKPLSDHSKNVFVTYDNVTYICADVLLDIDYMVLSKLVTSLICGYTKQRLSDRNQNPYAISIPDLVKDGLIRK